MSRTTDLTVRRHESGYAVFRGKDLLSIHDTNGQAWRALDRAENEPINRQEQVSDWVAEQILRRP
jgi:hypothetical protein